MISRTRTRPHRAPTLTALVVLVVLVVAGGCRDASELPTAVLLTGETRETLLLGHELPSPVQSAQDVGLEVDLEAPLSLWERSWDEGASGAESRSRVYRRVVGPLAGRLGVSGVRAAVGSLGSALEAADVQARPEAAEAVLEALESAAASHRDAERALVAGDADTALEAAFFGSDVLRSAGPESVARSLLMRAEEALDLAQTAFSGMELPEPLERGDRLARGAQLALEEGDWERALQRAFYACQLLGVSPY